MSCWVRLFNEEFQRAVALPEPETNTKLKIHYFRCGMNQEDLKNAYDLYKVIEEELLYLYQELHRTLSFIGTVSFPNEKFKRYFKQDIYLFDKHLKLYFFSSPNFHLPVEGLMKALGSLLRVIEVEESNNTFKINIFDDLAKSTHTLLHRCEKYKLQEQNLAIYKV